MQMATYIFSVSIVDVVLYVVTMLDKFHRSATCIALAAATSVQLPLNTVVFATQKCLCSLLPSPATFLVARNGAGLGTSAVAKAVLSHAIFF